MVAKWRDSELPNEGGGKLDMWLSREGKLGIIKVRNSKSIKPDFRLFPIYLNDNPYENYHRFFVVKV